MPMRAVAPLIRGRVRCRMLRQRRALRHLDPHLLRDIGLTEQAAAVEAEKPFWQD